MLTIEKPPGISKGGVACRYCKFWQPYTQLELDINGLVGKWGSCSQIDNKAKAFANPESFRETEKDRLNVQIVQLSLFNIKLYTADTYSCKNYREQESLE